MLHIESVNFYANEFINYFLWPHIRRMNYSMIHYSNRLFAMNLLSVNYLWLHFTIQEKHEGEGQRKE